MSRRILTTMLGLSLASLSPMPLSACAVLMSLPADCAPAPAVAAPASHCEQVMASQPQSHKDEATLQANAAELPCCKIASAPVPDAGAGISKVKVAPAPAALANVSQESAVKIFEHATAQPEQEPAVSPPDRQPLLCTFLI